MTLQDVPNVVSIGPFVLGRILQEVVNVDDHKWMILGYDNDPVAGEEDAFGLIPRFSAEESDKEERRRLGSQRQITRLRSQLPNVPIGNRKREIGSKLAT